MQIFRTPDGLTTKKAMQIRYFAWPTELCLQGNCEAKTVKIRVTQQTLFSGTLRGWNPVTQSDLPGSQPHNCQSCQTHGIGRWASIAQGN